MRQYAGEDEPCNSVDLHALPLKHDIISCLAVGARWITSNPLLQVFGFGISTYLNFLRLSHVMWRVERPARLKCRAYGKHHDISQYSSVELSRN